MTVIYLDTSVAVHVLNGHGDIWFDRLAESDADDLVSSRLLQTELTRVLRREGLPVARREEILDAVDQTPVTESILTAAEAIGVHLKTLDSIHLATALAFGSDVVVATHDTSMKAAVDAVGLTWVDPVVAGG